MEGAAVVGVGFAALFGLMLLRVPIGIAMGIVGFSGFAALTAFQPAMRLMELSVIRSLTDPNFGLVPLFVLMGALANASGMSNGLFSAANAWLGHRRGGLALSTIAACGGFAAICGSSVATAATLSKVALPEMSKRGYDKGFAAGTIAAGGTLGILIPPSLVLAVYGIITETDIGRLFVAGMLPGLLAILLYMGAIRVVSLLFPDWLPEGQSPAPGARRKSLFDVAPILIVFFLVIGGIYGGVFTPTEAAAIGAGLVAIVGILQRKLPPRKMLEGLKDAAITSGSLFMILIGAILFARFMTVSQFPQAVADWMLALELGRYETLALIVLFYLFLGCFMDTLAIILITVPIFYPTITTLGFDPIWFGVVVVTVTELGLITPPFGLNVFVIKGTASDVPLGAIYRGVLPYILTDLIRLLLIIAIPTIVLWLPSQM